VDENSDGVLDAEQWRRHSRQRKSRASRTRRKRITWRRQIRRRVQALWKKRISQTGGRTGKENGATVNECLSPFAPLRETRWCLRSCLPSIKGKWQSVLPPPPRCRFLSFMIILNPQVLRS